MFYGICVLQLVSLLAVQTTTTSAVSDVHVPRETEPKTSQWCIIWPDMRVPVGTTWKERCRKCKCVGNSHIVCKGGPKCNNPYKPYHEDFCGKWSGDGCCCEELGCFKYGRTIPFGDVYNDPPHDFCSKCQCLGFEPPRCWKRFCDHVMCVDSVPKPGECCPRCTRGPNCSIPKLTGVNRASVNTSPLLLTRTRRVKKTDGSYYLCRCMVPGTDSFCTLGGIGNSRSPRFG